MKVVTNVADRQVVVQKDHVLGNGEKMTFFADHWHEYPDGSLEVVDAQGNSVASFRPSRWDHVYFVDRVADIESRRS